MKDLIVRIIGENRVKAGLDSAKGDIQKFSDAGKTFVKSLKDELSGVATNIPGIGALTKAFGGAFTVAIGGAVALGNVLKNAIQDAAASWKDFQMSIDRDFTRMSKSAIDFNSKFTKARESGSPDMIRELVSGKQKEREDLLAEIRELERQRDTAGLWTQFNRAGRNAGKAFNERVGADVFGEGWFAKEDARNADLMASKQNDLATIDRQIALAKELERTNAAKAAENLRAQFANVGNDVFSGAAMKSAMEGTDAERKVAADAMVDAALSKLKNLQGISMPTPEDVDAKRAAMQQFVDASAVLDELRVKAERAPGEGKAETPEWFDETIKAERAPGEGKAETPEWFDETMKAERAPGEGKAETPEWFDETMKAWHEELKRLSEPIKAVADKADAKTPAAVADAVAMARQAARASRTFQSINAGEAFESLYGQRGNRDPAERTAAASEKALEVLKKIEGKTGAAP